MSTNKKSIFSIFYNPNFIFQAIILICMLYFFKEMKFFESWNLYSGLIYAIIILIIVNNKNILLKKKHDNYFERKQNTGLD